MSWLVTSLAGIAGMLLGAIGMFGISNACAKWYRISSFEGGSGYFVIGLSLLGATGGFVLAIIAARFAHAFVNPLWYSQLGSALAIVAAALLLVLTYASVGVDRSPTINGNGINIVWEVRLPVAGSNQYLPNTDPHSWRNDEMRLELVSVRNHKPVGSWIADFNREAFRQENSQWILVGKVPLLTSKGDLCVNLTIGGRDDGFWPPMRPCNDSAYFDWSPWYRTNKSIDKPDDTSSLMYRFKFEAIKQ